MRVVLPFKLIGQKLVKGRDFPKSVADGSKDSIVIKVGGIPDGCIATGYFKLSWESNTTYDLIFDGDELVVDEHIVTLPAHATNKYVDYKFSFSVAIWEGGVERLTTTPVEIVVEKSNYSNTTTNTPDVPENQYTELVKMVAEINDLASNLYGDVSRLTDTVKEVESVNEDLIVKTDHIMGNDEYAYAVCDRNGNVSFGVKLNGEKVGFGGEGSTSVATTVDYTKCGLTVVYLQEQEEGAYQEMIEAAKPENNYEKLEKVFNYTLRTAKGTDKFSGTCKLKFQGSSSLRNQYPKYNLTFKAVEEAFEATAAVSARNGEEITLNPWGAQKKYCLKANWIDPSNARNVVNARLWGKIVDSRASSSVVSAVTDLRATSPNKGAIDGFPCVVILNGEFNGLYTFNIPKDGWMFGMGDGTAEYVVGGENNSESACGFYSTPTFVDEADFAIEHIPDGVADETLIASFQTAVNEVKDAPDSADWETAVAPYFDIDSAIDYYIFTCCISGHDNLRKNALYATYDGVKWFMSAYDLDTTLGSNTYGTGVYPVKTKRTQFYEAANGGQKHRLFELIYKYSKDKLKARYDELRNGIENSDDEAERIGILSNENVWYMFNNFVNAIPRAVYNMDAERWADTRDKYLYPMPATTTANVENYMQYYRMHTALLDKEMEV